MHGWSVDRVLLEADGSVIGCAQLLVRRLPVPFRALVYIPRGPMCSVEDTPAVLRSLAGHAASRHRGVAEHRTRLGPGFPVCRRRRGRRFPRDHQHRADPADPHPGPRQV
nr:aminoacyltransferase [Arthrobacter nitrophenolicus]